MRKRTALAIGIGAAAAGFFALRRSGLHEDLEWREATKPGEIVDVDGYGVHVIDQGRGPAIVLVHGFGGSTYSYRYQIPAFSRAHRVIAVDLKGFGYSERQQGARLTATAQAAMLKRLLERLGIERATFVGHSMGGGVLQRLAVDYPDAVDALVLAGSVYRTERMRGVLPSPVARALAPVIASLVASRLLSLAYYDTSKLDETVRAEYMRPMRIRGTSDGILSMMKQGRDEERPEIRTIKAPVLLLWGAHDRVVPLKTAQEIRRDLPSARLVVIEGAGHMLFEERPDDCNRAIEDFLREAVEPGRATLAEA
jgi:pimeloyl-ACP methyl ester carboxylesterase